MAANLIQTHSRQEAHHLLNLSFAQFQSGRDVVELQARITRRSKERDRLREQARSPFGDIDEYRNAFEIRPDARQIIEAIDALKPGDLILVPKSGRETKAAVIATAQRVNGTKLTLVASTKAVLQLQAGDFDTPPIKQGHIVLPESLAFTSPKFIKEVALRVMRTKPNKLHAKSSASKNFTELSHSVSQDPELRRRLIAAKSADRIDSELAIMEARINKSVQSVSAKFDELVQLMQRRGYVSAWNLTDQGRTLARIFHELDLVVAEALTVGLFDELNAAELASLLSTFVYEFRRAEDPPRPIIPTTLASKWKTLQALSNKIAQDEESSGLSPHRSLDPGLMDVTFAWASGDELIDILNEDLTAGDFVRTMKQLIDLLRQISLVAQLPETRDSALAASQALLRGVVAASQGSVLQ